MNKQEFLEKLRKGLSALPQADREERLAFYEEMIDDRVEEIEAEGRRAGSEISGKSSAESHMSLVSPESAQTSAEEMAVAEIGPVDDVIAQILADTPITTLIKERVKPAHRLQAWEIILLVLGSPLWLALLIAFAAIVLAFFIVLLSIVISCFAVSISVLAAGISCVLPAIRAVMINNLGGAVFMIGAGLLALGVGILLFLLSKSFAGLALKLCKKIPGWTRALFVRKEV